jgi:hypothetical protein
MSSPKGLSSFWEIEVTIGTLDTEIACLVLSLTKLQNVIVHSAVARIRKRKIDVQLLFTHVTDYKVPKKGWKNVPFGVPREVNFQLLTKLLKL